MRLDLDEKQRYSQQIALESIGLEGQLKLKNARVLCVGAGGLGSSLLLYLASAGVGNIGIIDPDKVELSNLHRQVIYQSHHIGQPKAVIAAQYLSALNPHSLIQSYPIALTASNAENIINQYDIIADCADTFAVTYLINDTCFALDKPSIFASVEKFAGQCAFFLGKKTPCFRCLFPEDITNTICLTCNSEGVLNTLPGLLGVLQAMELIKFILGLETPLISKLLTIDGLNLQFKSLAIKKNPACRVCHKTNLALNSSVKPISLKELKTRLADDENKNNILLDVRSSEEREAYHIGGIFIPLAELSHRLNELDLNQPIIVYCRSGKRSLVAARILSEAGCEDVSYLAEFLL